MSEHPADAVIWKSNPALPGPLNGIVTLFSSVWLGVILLTLLFLYSTIGSAGLILPEGGRIFTPEAWYKLQIREMRWFELTEFAWFHWWPFNLLMALICINVTVATLRRIPLNRLNLGVWMIHTGILTLAAGSVWYFSTKVEGDAPIIRRSVMIELPGAEPVRLAAVPGNRIDIDSDAGRYRFQISNTDPNWELLTGEDQGQRVFSVSVQVSSPDQIFFRQLLDGHPEYTEDVLPGQGRAVKVTGDKFVDQTVSIRLELMPQEYFHLMQGASLYLREVGQPEWKQRTIDDLPIFNNYINSAEEFWQTTDKLPAPDPLHIEVAAADADDPLPEVPLIVSSYLRFGEIREGRVEGGELNPDIRLLINSPEGPLPVLELAAFNPANNRGLDGALLFAWADDEAVFDALAAVIEPKVNVFIPETQAAFTVEIPESPGDVDDLPFQDIEGTDFSYRIIEYHPRFDDRLAGAVQSAVKLEIKTPERTFHRWLFDNPDFNVDFIPDPELSIEEQKVPTERRIVTEYVPGREPLPLTVVAGPDENQLRLIEAISDPRSPVTSTLSVGEPSALGASGASLHVVRFRPRTLVVTRPRIIPRQLRRDDQDPLYRMIRVELPKGSSEPHVWLPFHRYAFPNEAEMIRGFRFTPTRVRIPNGDSVTEIELMYGRPRMKLPASVVLDDFLLEEHVGGFTGQTASIRNWTSEIRFDDSTEAEGLKVKVNEPAVYGGYSYYQAQWDPPQEPRSAGEARYNGLNFTVLGVGNRHGVMVQLLGCCLAVIGMIYAFYVKPLIKRRRQQRIYAEVAHADNAEVERGEAEPQPEKMMAMAGEEELR